MTRRTVRFAHLSRGERLRACEQADKGTPTTTGASACGASQAVAEAAVPLVSASPVEVGAREPPAWDEAQTPGAGAGTW